MVTRIANVEERAIYGAKSLEKVRGEKMAAMKMRVATGKV